MNHPAVHLEDSPWSSEACPLTVAQAEQFETLYRCYFDFVFRNLRRAGVIDAQVDDALQDVFLVVMRRIAEYRGGSNPRSWLFAILTRVASNYRRGERRRRISGEVPDAQPAPDRGPFEHIANVADAELLYRFLDTLVEGKREVFIMADLEQMTGKEISSALGIKLNTVYSRLRVAREQLVEFLDDQRASEDE